MTCQTAVPVVEIDRVHGWFRDTLYGEGGATGSIARTLARPVSVIWERVSDRRRQVARSGESLPGPVISVGNVTVGGGGKTSLVQWLLTAALPRSASVAVLARGYGRHGDGVVVGRPDGVSDPASLGDEPALLVRLGARVGIAADRRAAANAVQQDAPADVFVLDDGLQTRVPRDLDLVVFSERDLMAPARCVPAGPLRQSAAMVPERGAWISTGGDPSTRAWPNGSIGERFAPWWRDLPGTAASWADEGTSTLAAWSAGHFAPLPETIGRTVIVTGVADPTSAAAFAASTGRSVSRVVAFPDHHSFTRDDIRSVLARYPSSEFVTTEKDAIKLHPEWFEDRPVGVLQRRLVPDAADVIRDLVRDVVDTAR